MTNKNKLYQLIADVFNIDILDVNEQSNPESIENWDSFNGFVLLDDLETKFNVKFSLDEVTAVKNVGDIKQHLQNHGVTFDE
jgi:acyl carrier protein